MALTWVGPVLLLSAVLEPGPGLLNPKTLKSAKPSGPSCQPIFLRVPGGRGAAVLRTTWHPGRCKATGMVGELRFRK